MKNWLKSLYFNFLLWLENINLKKDNRYLSPKEIAAIVKQYSKIGEGVTVLKSKVNDLVKTKNKEEYDKILDGIQDLIPLSVREQNPDMEKFICTLKKNYAKNKDITTPLEKENMINQRIKDMYELHEHIEKRNKLREIRKAKSAGQLDLVDKLEKEFYEKYGR